MERITSLHSTFLLNNALAPYLDAFNDRLRRGRYAAVTINKYISGITHFARWMTRQEQSAQSLDENSVMQFLGEHLPRCDCSSPVLRDYRSLRAALGHLLSVLREQGVVPIPPPPTGDIADELRRYDEHMNNARGLADGTRSGYLRIVQRLLLHKFPDRPVVFTELQPIDIRQFIIEQLERVDTISKA